MKPLAAMTVVLISGTLNACSMHESNATLAVTVDAALPVPQHHNTPSQVGDTASNIEAMAIEGTADALAN